ncbi:MAG TPA: PEGA domain-containing protein [Kofleriaceae bacterium]|nr:PEGA domain-containing protein [Kofleriaceae bacterium]
MRSGLGFVALSALAGAAGVWISACKGDAEPAAAPPPAPPTAITIDAAPPPDGITAIGAFDPSSGMHLDDDTPGARRGATNVVHTKRTLEILLRSSPTGATVAVDGVIVGQTPNYWEGDFTGREREFTFVMPGYAMARYRFVPTTNGIVHGRLTKIVADQDAGVPAIPRPTDLAAPAVSGAPDAGTRVIVPPPIPPPVIPTSSVVDAGALPAPGIVDGGPPPP